MPPYKDHDEESWKNYYDQRAALDEVNTTGNAAAYSIISEELGQDTWKLLRKASDGVAAMRAYTDMSTAEETIPEQLMLRRACTRHWVSERPSTSHTTTIIACVCMAMSASLRYSHRSAIWTRWNRGTLAVASRCGRINAEWRSPKKAPSRYTIWCVVLFDVGLT